MARSAAEIASVVTLALLFLLPVAAPAQEPQGIGRSGYGWQTNQALEAERLKTFLVSLKPLPLDEWKAKTLAWLEIRPDGEDGAVAVPGSLHVRRIEVKNAEVEPIDPVSWRIAPAKKKLSRSMTVVLTDPDSTEVECPLRNVADGPDVLGIFLYQSAIHCVARGDT